MRAIIRLSPESRQAARSSILTERPSISFPLFAEARCQADRHEKIRPEWRSWKHQVRNIPGMTCARTHLENGERKCHLNTRSKPERRGLGRGKRETDGRAYTPSFSQVNYLSLPRNALSSGGRAS